MRYTQVIPFRPSSYINNTNPVVNIIERRDDEERVLSLFVDGTVAYNNIEEDVSATVENLAGYGFNIGDIKHAVVLLTNAMYEKEVLELRQMRDEIIDDVVSMNDIDGAISYFLDVPKMIRTEEIDKAIADNLGVVIDDQWLSVKRFNPEEDYTAYAIDDGNNVAFLTENGSLYGTSREV